VYAWNSTGGWHPDTLTSPTGLITTGATGPASLIQGNFGAVGNGNYEVVVPTVHGLEHLWHDNTKPGSGWPLGEVIPTSATGPASLIQTAQGPLEVVVQQGTQLVADIENLSTPTHAWHQDGVPFAGTLAGNPASGPVTGPAGLIQGTFGKAGNGNFELVVPEGNNLVTLWRDNTTATQPWAQGATLVKGLVVSSAIGTGAGTLPYEVSQANADTTGGAISLLIDPLLTGKTIQLSGSLVFNNPVPNESIAIDAPSLGADSLTTRVTIAGGGPKSNFSVFVVEPNTFASLDGLFVTQGRAVYNLGTFDADNSTFSFDSAFNGGGGDIETGSSVVMVPWTSRCSFTRITPTCWTRSRLPVRRMPSP
jgi:hypothetical protein